MLIPLTAKASLITGVDNRRPEYHGHRETISQQGGFTALMMAASAQEARTNRRFQLIRIAKFSEEAPTVSSSTPERDPK
jgi:hypothetical protein